MANFTGQLLVATPSLRDPNFERTVVFIIEHSDEGAVGVVLNRPSDAAVSAILPTWDYLAVPPAVVFLGGPVALNGVICLGRSALGQALGPVDLELDADDALAGIRVFAGHAGWGPTQLEEEVEAGGWLVLDALVDDAFAGAPEELWPLVLRRQGGALARLAHFPDDPSSN